MDDVEHNASKIPRSASYANRATADSESCRPYPARLGPAAAVHERHLIGFVPADLPSDVCRDRTDIPVVGTAVSGECALLIGVDRDLLDMQRIIEIPIIRPGEYWRRTTGGG